MTTTPEREEFEAFWLWRFEKGAKRRETALQRRADDTYLDESCQRHWWTWQQAIKAAAARQIAPESCKKVDDCTESLCMQANRCKHTLPPQPQRLCVEQGEPRQFKECVAVEDGWCEWQAPVMRGYLMKCCDCGLVHEVEFDALKVTGHNEDGTFVADVLPGDSHRVHLRMRRHEDGERNA